MTSQRITEAVTLTRPKGTAGTNGNRWRVRIIEGNIWGSSGFYPAEVLERDGATTWPAGTQIFFDHPGDFEDRDRPERSVRDLAGRLATDPVYDGDGLYAEADFYSWAAPVVAEMKDDIGLSIRASAQGEPGERDGRRGLIVTRLFDGQSVDLVTKPGAGGRLVELLESARPNATHDTTTDAHKEGDMTVIPAPVWELFEALRAPDPAEVTASAISHGVTEATANDTRDALQGALRGAYGGNQSWLYVRDFDESTVWYGVETGEGSTMYAQPYTIAADLTVALGEDRQQVRPISSYVTVAQPDAGAATEAATESADSTGSEPAEPATAPTLVAEADTPEPVEGSTTDPVTPVTDAAEAADPSQEDTMSNTQGAGGAAPTTPRQVMEARLAEQGRQIAEMRASQLAGPVVAEVLATGWISEAQRARITGQLLQALPLTDELTLDEAALRNRATEALEAAETEAAEILNAAGVGTPRGLSALTSPATEAAAAQTDSVVAESLKGAFGLSDAATNIAVKGR